MSPFNHVLEKGREIRKRGKKCTQFSKQGAKDKEKGREAH